MKVAIDEACVSSRFCIGYRNIQTLVVSFFSHHLFRDVSAFFVDSFTK